MAVFGSVAIAGASTRLSAVAAPSRLSSSAMGGCWESQMNGDGRLQLKRAMNVTRLALPVRPRIRMMAGGNNSGIFAPLVILARNILGAKKLNQLRGKGIALHSQVITEFCKSIGADSKQRQGLIRLAKKNGQKLGFLA